MLQKEFEDRIGRSVTEQEYVEADAVYMAAGDMDKDEFCREWLKIGSSRLVRCLAETAHQKGKKVQELELLHKETMDIVNNAADAMLEIEKGLLDYEEESPCRCANAAELLNREALWLVGTKEVVLRKIRMGMELSEDEKIYIKEHLK